MNPLGTDQTDEGTLPAEETTHLPAETGKPLKEACRQETAGPSPKKIRVGFVMHVMQVAGAEVLVKQIVERLAPTVESTILCLDGVGELGHQLRDSDVPVVVLDRRPGLDRRVASRIADEVQLRGIEVLHAHQYTPFFYSALARLIHRAPAKILFTEHGRHYPDVVSFKRWMTNRLVLQRLANIATACCDFSTAALQDNEGFPKAVTLANGVDLSGLPPRDGPAERDRLRRGLGLDLDRPYAACVGRLHPVKDQGTLLRAWKHVAEQLPDARLLLVGDGPERSNYERLCGELNLEDSVEFWGIRGDVGVILRAVDVFTLTSVSEAASLTLLEAMASELPSVLTNVGGNGEHVRDGVEGFLVPRGDSKRVAEKLCELLQNRELAASMGAAARRRVIEHFSLERTIDAYHHCYRQLAS